MSTGTEGPTLQNENKGEIIRHPLPLSSSDEEIQSQVTKILVLLSRVVAHYNYFNSTKVNLKVKVTPFQDLEKLWLQ